MLRLKPIKKEDFLKIELEVELGQEERQKFYNYNTTRGFTLWEGDYRVCLGGTHRLWPGVHEAWFMMSPRAYEIPVSVARYSKKALAAIIKEGKIRRTQCAVSAVDNRALQFATFLDFKHEGLMKSYGLDGSDYHRFARIA